MAPLLAAQPCRAASHSTASCSGRPPAAPGTPARLAPPGRQRRRTCRRAPLLTCASAADGGGSSKPHPEEGEPVGGDGALQDSLVQRLQFEIGKKRVDEFVEAESEGLRAKAEEAKEELDKLAELQNLKAEVAFNSALADINREADEFEEKLRKSREEREAAEAELEAWEDATAVARSQGQFFQNLYPRKGKKGGRPSGAAGLATPEELQEQRDRVVEPARTEVSSRLRYYLFAFLAFVLGTEVVLDLQSDAPSALNDVIYTLLVVAIGVTAFNERRLGE